jgi:hypothetical protein
MKHIFIINGCGRSGKDTFVQFFKEIEPRTLNISTVDKVKEAATILGWKGGKEEKDRKFLSDLLDLADDYCGHTFSNVIERVDEAREKYEYVFIHSRTPSDIEKFKKYFIENRIDCDTILVVRPGQNINSNHADRDVNKYQYDFTINNDKDLKKFKDTVFSFWEQNIAPVSSLKDNNLRP